MEDYDRDPARDIIFTIGRQRFPIVAMTNRKLHKTLFAIHGGKLVNKNKALIHIRAINGVPVGYYR